MRFGVRECQGRAPRPAKDHCPFGNPKLRAEVFDISDQVACGVLTRLGKRGRSARSTLVHQDHHVDGRIEIDSVAFRRAISRPAMKIDYCPFLLASRARTLEAWRTGFPVGLPILLIVQ